MNRDEFIQHLLKAGYLQISGYAFYNTYVSDTYGDVVSVSVNLLDKKLCYVFHDKHFDMPLTDYKLDKFDVVIQNIVSETINNKNKVWQLDYFPAWAYNFAYVKHSLHACEAYRCMWREIMYVREMAEADLDLYESVCYTYRMVSCSGDMLRDRRVSIGDTSIVERLFKVLDDTIAEYQIQHIKIKDDVRGIALLYLIDKYKIRMVTRREHDIDWIDDILEASKDAWHDADNGTLHVDVTNIVACGLRKVDCTIYYTMNMMAVKCSNPDIDTCIIYRDLHESLINYVSFCEHVVPEILNAGEAAGEKFPEVKITR